jgi:hypothetical protein
VKRAWFFGCSMTKGVGLGTKANYWSKQVSDSLGYEHINLGRGGSSNEVTLNTFCQNLLNFKPGDIIIVGITCIRLTFPYNHKNEIEFTGHPRYINANLHGVDMDTKIKIIDIVTQSILPFNLHHVNWYVNSFSNLQDYLAKNNIRVIIWDTTHWDKHEIISEKDHHWSQKGHNTFAKFLLDSIKTHNDKLFSRNLL